MQKALGIIETYGLLAAVAVADTMVKAANVELIGYELAKGQGMTAVKVEGDVGAVKAALASGEAQAREMGLFRGKNLIPRPAVNLDMMVFNEMTIGSQPVFEIESKCEPEAETELKPEVEEAYTCNICKDPACPRKARQPHKLCIHFEEIDHE